MRDPGTMARAFLSALPDDTAPPDAAAIGAAITAIYDIGRAAWPDIVVEPAAYARHLGALATARAPLPREDFAADVYLACACALGDVRAIHAFERLHGASIERAVARASPTPALGEE